MEKEKEKMFEAR